MRLFNRLWRRRGGPGSHAGDRGRRGHAVIEVALLSPWIFFLFAGVLDLGFYAYGLISTENAARVAAIYASTNSNTASDSSGSCTVALAEMNSMTNVMGVSGCTGSSPVTVTASPVTGVDGAPAASVSVTYQFPAMIPIPGLMGQFTVTRIVQMKLRG